MPWNSKYIIQFCFCKMILEKFHKISQNFTKFHKISHPYLKVFESIWKYSKKRYPRPNLIAFFMCL